MKKILLFIGLISAINGAFPIYNDQFDFGNNPGYTVQPGKTYKPYTACSQNAVYVQGFIKDFNGYDCGEVGVDDYVIDDYLDTICENEYGAGSRNVRGIELHKLYYNDIQFFNFFPPFNGLSANDFTTTQTFPAFTVPSCSGDGNYCGGSCGRTDGVEQCGRRICAENDNRDQNNYANCMEIPPNNYWDDYDPSGKKNDWVLPVNNQPNQQGGQTTCWSQRKDENIIVAMCVTCQTGTFDCDADPIPCGLPVVAGEDFGPYTIGVLPGADGVKLSNANTNFPCTFDYGIGAVDKSLNDCELEINPPLVVDNTIDIAFKAEMDGFALIHQFVNCADNAVVPISIPQPPCLDRTIFVIRTKPSPNNKDEFTNGQISVTGCDVIWLDPTTGAQLQVGGTYDGDIPAYDGGNAIAVECVPNNEMFFVDCVFFNP